MIKKMDIERAREIMGDGFIGPEELSGLEKMDLIIPAGIPDILISEENLKTKADDYMLILGLSSFMNGEEVSIRNMLNRFGNNPDGFEPCFYNQDWYLREPFIDETIKEEWFLIRKDIYEESRAVDPKDLVKEYSFPPAVRCCYAFFVSWLAKEIKLWYHDFVWCSDTDHNGDRIYVGKYHDVDGVNKNGFSVHRYLGLRDCYGCVD